MISPIGSNTPPGIPGLGTTSRSTQHPKLFAKLDANSDGGISLSELDALAAKTKDAQGAGSSGDAGGLMAMVRGKLAKDGAAAMMKEIDVNQDGVIDQAENDRFVENYLDAARAAGRPPGPPPGEPPPQRGNTNAGEAAATVFDALDTNQDGTVSLDELKALAEKSDDASGIKSLLKQMDGNGDKSISKDEFTSFLLELEQADETRRQQAGAFREGEPPIGTNVNTVA